MVPVKNKDIRVHAEDQNIISKLKLSLKLSPVPVLKSAELPVIRIVCFQQVIEIVAHLVEDLFELIENLHCLVENLEFDL